VNPPSETAYTLFDGDSIVENAAKAMPDKPLTRTALQTTVVWPKTVYGQADASDRLLQCDDPGIPRCSPQSQATLCSPVARVKLMLTFRIDPESLFANSLRHASTSLPRKSILPAGKRQKWLPGFDNGDRVVPGFRVSNRHPTDLTLEWPSRGSEHSQLDALAPSVNCGRHATSNPSDAPSDCPSHPLNPGSATDPSTSDALPCLMSGIDSLRTQEGQGQVRIPPCNPGYQDKEEANLALRAGLDSVLFLMTSVLGGFLEWKWRQPCLEAGQFPHAISSCV
jgi:hypothetical protein